MGTFKEQVHQHYMQILQRKIADLQKVLAELKDMGANETKSTAGDKHETALAMLQIEQANKRAQLQELLQQQAQLNKIDPTIKANIVLNGSLIATNKGYLFISVALGKAIVDTKQVIALSPQSPLAAQLMRLSVGACINLNGNAYQIEGLE